MTSKESSSLIAFVGSYGAAPGASGGGIYTLGIGDGGRQLAVLHHMPEPREAGYIVCAPDTPTLYAVDERKTDGRGPVAPAASVHAFEIESRNGQLRPRNKCIAPGPRPTYLDYSARHRLLFSANHGDFQHVEKVSKQADGTWRTEYVYDDSTVCVFSVGVDGAIGFLADVLVLEGHGPDPNTSLQNGGHAQASPHAHCAVIDPSGDWLLVCDKGSDRVHVIRIGSPCRITSSLKLEAETGPRHMAFDPASGLVFMTCEFSSELAALSFDAKAGRLVLLGKVRTVANDYSGRNEPAEVRVHPSGNIVYANNRGEDSLAWFRAWPDGRLERLGSVPLSASIHPGLAARSFEIDASGSLLVMADRSGHLVRSYACSPETGDLERLAEISIPDPACVAFQK